MFKKLFILVLLIVLNDGFSNPVIYDGDFTVNSYRALAPKKSWLKP